MRRARAMVHRRRWRRAYTQIVLPLVIVPPLDSEREFSTMGAFERAIVLTAMGLEDLVTEIECRIDALKDEIRSDS